MIEIVDQSNSGLYSQNQDLINNFTDYSSKNLDFDKPVKVYFMNDEENAKDPLGKTGFYNPDTMEIKIYVTGRHLKDILRSISHELIHHVQNCRGDFGSLDSTEAGYAQSNDHLRGMEQEAYTQGNIMNFRDFEDNYKRGIKTMSETKINKLKAMVREGVREVLSEISLVGVPSKIKQQAMNSPEFAGAYLATQNESGYVNEDEGLVVQDSVQKWLEAAKKDPTIAKRFIDAYYKQGGERPMQFRASFGGLSDVKEPDIDKKLADMERINKSAQSSAPAAASAPAASTSGQSSAKCVTDCPQGSGAVSNAKYPAGVCEKDGQIVALICDPDASSQARQAATPGQTKRYKECKTNIQKGCAGDNVKTIQNLLGVNPDGKFWTNTKKAVQAFQRSNGLKPNGIVDKDTLKALVDRSRKQRTDRTPEEKADIVSKMSPATAAAALTATNGDAGAASTAGPVTPAATTRAEVDQLFNSLSGQTRALFSNAYKAAIGKSDEDPQMFDKIKRILAGVDGIGTKQFQQRYAKLRQLGGLVQLEESLTINQRKLNEAKSLFERLKKVL